MLRTPRTLLRAAGAALAVLSLCAPAAHASADDSSWYKEPNVNATWSQAWITEPDGTKLHADILRPAGLKATDKSPVILSAGPYFGHAGEVGPAGPVEGADYDPLGPPGPSRRFQDFVIGGKLMQKGYTFVMVDLRGFGGSTGCLDWGGAGEQADVKSAVEWAAKQSWSTGKVGMYGKSYDGVTGLMGIAQQPVGLAAVVSQEPVFDLYRYLYSNGVRFENSLATPALYDAIAGTPGQGMDSTDYLSGSVNDTGRLGCPVGNYADQAADNDHTSAYWKARDFIAADKGKTTPLFLTQGFLENNTKPDGAWDVYNGMAGPKKGWFGMWDHIRGNETAEGVNDTPLFFEDTMHFFDHYVAGKSLAEAPVDKDPVVRVQSDDGKWRNETRWPPADSQDVPTTLKTGTYTDDGQTTGTNALSLTSPNAGPGAEGVWTFSPPLTHDAQFSGVPRVKLDLSPAVGAPDLNGSPGLTDVNVAVDVYDVAPNADGTGKAQLLSRTTALIPTTGKLDLGMYGDEWHIPTGHRLAVLITDSNAEWYVPAPSMDDVMIKSASITLPFLKYTRDAGYALKVPARLGDWLADAPFDVPAKTITDATSPSFGIPAARTAAPPEATTTPGDTATTPGGTTPPSTGTPGDTTAPVTPVTTTGETPTAPPSGAAPGPATTPTPTPAVPAGPKAAFTTSVAVDRTLRRTVRRQGLRFRLRCSAACAVTAALTVDEKTVDALGLDSATIGTTTLKLGKAGRVTKRIKLSRSVAEAVLARGAAKVTLTTKVTAGATTRTVVRKVSLAGTL